jgi:hypothetical protein
VSGDDSHVVLVKKFSGWKGKVRRCIVVMHQPVFLSLNFGAKSSHMTLQSPQNVIVVCGIDCLACQDGGFFFRTIPLMSKKVEERALDSALHLFRFLGLGEFGLSVYFSSFLHWTLV